jgi:hypothetical protein
MPALARFETFVESILEGSFARLLRTRIQPLEIAKRLTRAMEAEQTIFAGKVVAPNEYVVKLNPEDFAAFEPAKSTWEEELAQYLTDAASEHALALFGSPLVLLEADASVAHREMRVAARVIDHGTRGTHATVQVDTPPPPLDIARTDRIDAARIRQAVETARQNVPILHIRGSDIQFPTRKAVLAIGRDLDNDVIIDSTSVSRYHAEIRLTDNRYVVYDLNSTNGTTVNGFAVIEQVLADGDRLSFAGMNAVFRFAR